MSLELQVHTSPVPQNLCFRGFNSSSWLDIVSLLHVTFEDDLTFFNFGNTVPAPDRRERPWVRTNADGSPDGIWVYAMGYWLQKHETPTGLVCMYEGTEASIETFDGGEAGAITTISGAFWEKVSEMDARSPIGPGTTAGGTTINVGDQLGEDEHAQTIAEMPTHHHEVQNVVAADPGNFAGGGFNGAVIKNIDTEDTGNGDAMNLIHPVTGIFFIRRTARTYRRI